MSFVTSYICIPDFYFLIFQTSSGSPLPSDTLAAGSLPAAPVSHNFHRERCMNVGWECSPGQSTGHRSCQEEKTEASDALTNVSDCTISTLVTIVQVPDELLDRKSISDSVGGPAINVPVLIVFQLYEFPRLLFLRFDSLAIFPFIQRRVRNENVGLPAFQRANYLEISSQIEQFRLLRRTFNSLATRGNGEHRYRAFNRWLRH